MAAHVPPKGPPPPEPRSLEDLLQGSLSGLDSAFEDEEPTLPAGGLDRAKTGPLPSSSLPTAETIGTVQPTVSLDIEVVLPEEASHLTLELLPDGRLRAPAPETRDLLRDRLRRAEVLRTGPGWAVLRTLESGLARTERPVIPEHEVIAAGILGDRGISLIDFIGFVANGQLTGVLTAATGEIERSVHFYRGDVVWASSSSHADRFGEFLLGRGKITREQLAIAARDGDKRIGRACVERGFLPAHELFGLVQAQLTEIFDKLIATETGMWFFTRASVEGLAASHIHLSTQGLLVDALRRLDEMQIYRQRVRTSGVIVQRVKAPKLPSGTETTTDDLLAQLDETTRPGAAQLLKNLPGSATIQELMRLVGRGEFEVTRTVYHLLRRGLVELVQAQETGPIPRRVAAVSKTEAHDVIGIYSMAFREMFEEVGRIGRQSELQAAANAFLRDESTAYAHLLRAASLGADGAIDEAAMLGALQGMSISSQELSDALSELLFFVLFQATEYLGRRRGDDLARRVKLILGMLAHTTGGGGEPIG